MRTDILSIRNSLKAGSGDIAHYVSYALGMTPEFTRSVRDDFLNILLNFDEADSNGESLYRVEQNNRNTSKRSM